MGAAESKDEASDGATSGSSGKGWWLGDCDICSTAPVPFGVVPDTNSKPAFGAPIGAQAPTSQNPSTAGSSSANPTGGNFISGLFGGAKKEAGESVEAMRMSLHEELCRLCSQGATAKLVRFLDATKDVTLDATDENGSTAMHLAAAEGHIETCKVLLHRGAAMKRNRKGLLPHQLADASGYQVCSELLQAESERIRSGDHSAHTGTTCANNGGEFKHPNLEQDNVKQHTLPKTEHRPHHHHHHHHGHGNTDTEKPAYALYPYVAHPTPPFPPDSRLEITMEEGSRFAVLSVRKDGWCLVRLLNPKDSNDNPEGFVPGNYLGSLSQHDHGQPVVPVFGDQ